MLRIDKLTPEKIAQLSTYIEMWFQIISTPINQKKAAEVLAKLYQRVGYEVPKIVFFDSPLAVEISAASIFLRSPDIYKPYHIDSASYFLDDLGNHLTQQKVSINQLIASEIYNLTQSLYGQYRRQVSPSIRMQLERHFTKLACDKLCTPKSLYKIEFKNRKWLEWLGVIDDLKDRITEQLEVKLDQDLIEEICLIRGSEWYRGDVLIVNPPSDDYHWGSYVEIAALFDYAAAIGVEFEPESLQFLWNVAMYLEFFIPWKEICLVSDRPQRKFDSQGKLHAEGEPCLLYPYRGLGNVQSRIFWNFQWQ